MAGVSLLNDSDLSPETARRLTGEALAGADDGELFIERRQTESFSFDDGRLKLASFDASTGFGLRAMAGETTAFAHATELSEAALARAAATCRSILAEGRSPTVAPAPPRSNRSLYGGEDPVAAVDFAAKVALLERIDAFTRALDPRVAQVTVSLALDHQAIEIIRADGFTARDLRPLLRGGVSVRASNGKTAAQAAHGFGGRDAALTYFDDRLWQEAAREALRQALVGLEAEPAPAGEMDVILGPGWPGILLHEAVGHGLEGDFNRKGTSAFAGLMGQRVAAPGVTIVDDGTLPLRRGSISTDDEGTPSQCTTLIEDGILTGYMQDRLNARLMGVAATGNGRRQSHAHAPMPRMTNTYMLAGPHEPDEIFASMERGLYARSFGGGQVDITSGKFVFSCTEAYLVEKGRITRPVKGATLIGTGSDALTRIAMVGNDMALDSGIGTCGKGGQGVAVGVGQPTLRINRLTVGGTAA